MVKVHKLVAAIATTITLSTTSAYALNMGEISWKSSYGQPLNARIELSDAKHLQARDIKPSIASASDFAKAGIEQSADLSSLRFNTIVNPDGTGYIEITSSKPIKEPFLNFLVDVNSNDGKISKEYTVLLDIVESKTTATSLTNKAPKITAPVQQSSETYNTKRGDTLWSIAQQIYGKTLTAKAAKAIYDKNPKAFINGNAGALLANYSLKLPTEQEINTISISQATAFLKAPADSSTTTTDKPANKPAKATTTDPKQTEQVKQQLEKSEKELITARTENDELNTQLKQLQSEIDRLEEISQQKDSQIAKVESQIVKANSQKTTVKAADETKKVEQDKTTTENTIAEEEAKKVEQAKIAAEKAKAEEEAKKAEQAKIAAQKTKAEEEAKKAEQAKIAAEKAKKASIVAQQNDEKNSPSFLSSLLENNLLLMAGGGVLLIICLIALLLRRRKAANDDSQIVDLSDVTLDDDLDDQGINNTMAQASETDDKSSQLSQLGEGMGVIDKAEIYLAYNHYDEAKELLTNALQEDPTNTDYRLKLMEIHAEKGETSNFEAEEQELLLLDPLSQHKIDSLKEKYPTINSDFSFATAPSMPVQNDSTSPNDLTITSVTNELAANAASKETNIADVKFDFSTPITEEIDTKPAEPANKIDSFELDKITPDSDSASNPLFDTNIDEEDFSSDSPALDFSKEEVPLEEEKEDNIRFDLGTADESPEINYDHFSQPAMDDLDEVIEKDQVTTKLELVNAYIDMGDTEGAQDLLEEIIQEGNDSQKTEAKALLLSITPSASFQETPSSTSDFKVTTSTAHENIDSESNNSLFDSVDHANTALTELDLGFELPPEDEASTKLELANAYIEMGDKHGAKDILEEVLSEGTEEQRNKAQELLRSIS